MTVNNKSARCQIRLYCSVTGNAPWFIASVPMHRRGAARRRQCGKMRCWIALQDNQLAIERIIQSMQGMMQPPAASPAHSVVGCMVIIKNIDRDHRAILRGGGQGRIVSKA